MTKQLVRWVRLIALLVVLAMAVAPVFGCDDDDDDDNNDDTTDADDDDDDDDNDDVAPTSIELDPVDEAVPVGTTAGFTALVTYSDDTTALDPPELTWSIADDAIATVTDGVVTGVAAGQTTLTAAIAELSATAPIYVAPDTFVFDMFTGTVDLIDRGAQTYMVDDFGSGSLATVPNRLIFHEGFLYLIDSADYGPGVTGGEKVVKIDALDGAVTDIALDMDSPWANAFYEGVLYATGNLSDELAVITPDKAIQYVDLPTGCAPGDLTGANGKVYVSCTGFDGMNYGDTVAVYDPSTKGVSEITLAAGVNPGSAIATVDEAFVYVATAGNYVDITGTINKIDTATDTVTNSFSIGGTLGLAALSWCTDVLFVLDGTGMYAIDTANDDDILRGEGDPIVVGEAGAWLSTIHVHADTGNVYVGNQNFVTFVNEVEIYDGDTFAFIETYDVSATFSSPGGIASW